MSQHALVFDGVSRRFGSKVALDRLDLTVEPGSVLGLVGRNGAGKTTALKLAHGLLHPDEGRISVVGLDPVTEGLEVRKRVSLLSEESALFRWMTVEEILRFGGALHPRWDPALAADLSRRLDLDPKEKVKGLSRGTRAKVALVLAVACRPELLLLDDPTAGLDPLVRREVLESILETVSGDGGAVIYASHLVHDLERVADHLLMLDSSRVVLSGSLDQIKSQIKRATAVFESGAPPTADLPGTIEVRSEGRVLTVFARTVNGELEGSLRALGAKSVDLETLSLEEILVTFLRRDGNTKRAGEETSHV